jgi:hypothetical protein
VANTLTIGVVHVVEAAVVDGGHSACEPLVLYAPLPLRVGPHTTAKRQLMGIGTSFGNL